MGHDFQGNGAVLSVPQSADLYPRRNDYQGAAIGLAVLMHDAAHNALFRNKLE